MADQEKVCKTCKHYTQFQQTNCGDCAMKPPFPDNPNTREGTWDDMSCPRWESVQLAPPELPNLDQNPPTA